MRYFIIEGVIYYHPKRGINNHPFSEKIEVKIFNRRDILNSIAKNADVGTYRINITLLQEVSQEDFNNW